MWKTTYLICFVCIGFLMGAQSHREAFEKYKRQNRDTYNSVRKEYNEKYSEYLRKAWKEYSESTPVPRPKDPVPLPPKPYIEPIDEKPIHEEKDKTIGEPIRPIIPLNIPPVLPEPQPVPVAPIEEIIIPGEKILTFDFYGNSCKVRMPEYQPGKLLSNSNIEVANGWEILSKGHLDNLIVDCLRLRDEYRLCDWAYLQFLDNLSQSICGETDEATLLLSWLYSQSGYQMRLGNANNKLVMLFGSKHLIYDRSGYILDGITFYPYNAKVERMKIAQIAFPGEKPLSLNIDKEPIVGMLLSDERSIFSKKYSDVSVVSQVKKPLIDFFNTYPTSAIGGNMMTRWAMYANTPLSSETRNILYPQFAKELQNLTPIEGVERILNWVQTGFEYGYDDEIWGGDRAFFAEETLYYPYSDCEDRSILFSRLVRDLFGLEVALLYYPGHLATAVRFTEDVKGAKVQINGSEFTVCDPTYIGAPVGVQMPGLDSTQIQAIILQ